MRTAFINQLIVEARKNEKIFLIVGDLGFSVVESFIKEFPNRFLNAGISEQNMAGIAAGLAMEGFNVFIYSIGNFPTLRCMEQIRYDICYHNLNVKIIAVGGGFAYGPLGASHHATEEIGMLRIIPNMVVCAPGDPVEAQSITTFASKYQGPCYIRIGKAGEPLVHNQHLMPELFLGDILKIKSKGNVAVFSTGAMLKYCVDFISINNINASVFSFPFIKPINREELANIVNSYEKIITIEEHQAQGGFGSAILEIIHELLEEKKLIKLPQIKRIAIKNVFFSKAGSQDFLRQSAQLELNSEMFNISLDL